LPDQPNSVASRETPFGDEERRHQADDVRGRQCSPQYPTAARPRAGLAFDQDRRSYVPWDEVWTCPDGCFGSRYQEMRHHTLGFPLDPALTAGTPPCERSTHLFSPDPPLVDPRRA
jgi:hypothetical protein